MPKKGVLIGIAGASGSGKTLVARTLHDSLGSEQVLNLQEDSYYQDLSHLPFEERTRFNFDHPDAFNHQLLFTQLSSLLNRQSIQQPVYDFTRHIRSVESRTIQPQPIIILEGILVLAVPEIRDLMNIRIYVDTPPDICFIRRLERDIQERGRSVESVIKQYQETVRPMFMQFIEPSKRYADIIIPHGGKNVIAIDIIQAKIEKLLSTK
ncbi:MAG: uridine kinase [Caldithrix sp. RBG_13_44_9]|nr:MAG: uridine kinase [Caldithrix sp. RBG_13_44_9]